MKKLDLSEKLTCNLVSKTFAYVAGTQNWYEINFCKWWLKSQVCQRLAEQDETIICQSKIYVYNDIINEIKSGELVTHLGYQMNKPILQWFGYTTMYWMLQDNISGRQLLGEYNIEEIIAQYDTLHTMSVKTAIRYIKENYSQLSCIKDNIFT